MNLGGIMNRLDVVVCALIGFFMSFSAHGSESVFDCAFWQPDQKVERFKVSQDKGSGFHRLSDKQHYVRTQILETGELSIALHDIRTNDLISVARGSLDVTHSVINPRFLVACYQN